MEVVSLLGDFRMESDSPASMEAMMGFSGFGECSVITRSVSLLILVRPGSHLQHNDITEGSRKPKKHLMLNVLHL